MPRLFTFLKSSVSQPGSGCTERVWLLGMLYESAQGHDVAVAKEQFGPFWRLGADSPHLAEAVK
ncbi:hypothetical protein AC579_6160 [Pseudocercospora musae]|uniref:Uncharacterized protein n=1 Tax=Pseudocercospora musae TaxID=113226 RepID=A0A139I583_9PEZI|nr:hypothetical protein AC579_6160 [Pseudocercospora musae]